MHACFASCSDFVSPRWASASSLRLCFHLIPGLCSFIHLSFIHLLCKRLPALLCMRLTVCLALGETKADRHSSCALGLVIEGEIHPECGNAETEVPRGQEPRSSAWSWECLLLVTPTLTSRCGLAGFMNFSPWWASCLQTLLEFGMRWPLPSA